TDPWRKSASAARREAARRVMTTFNARRRKGDGIAPSKSPLDHGTAPLPATRLGEPIISATAQVDRDPKTETHREERDVRERGCDELCPGLPADLMSLAEAETRQGSAT